MTLSSDFERNSTILRGTYWFSSILTKKNGMDFHQFHIYMTPGMAKYGYEILKESSKRQNCSNVFSGKDMSILGQILQRTLTLVVYHLSASISRYVNRPLVVVRIVLYTHAQNCSLSIGVES